MKIALIALVLVVSLAQTEAYWGYGYGGLYGGMWGGMYGGLYGGMYGGLYGGYGTGYWGKRDATLPPTEILNRTECIYSKEAKMLSCHGSAGIVECEAESTWSTPVSYQMFSLALFNDAEKMPMTKYRLMPRKFDNSGWESGMYMDKVTGEKKFSSLYSVESADVDMGLMVKDKQCFKELIDLLALSNRRELVEVESERLYVIGDLMVAKKMPVQPESVSDKKIKETKKVKRSVSDDDMSLVDELKEFKARSEQEWDLVDRNTNTLMDAVNELKRSMDDFLEVEHSPLERRNTDMWTDAREMSAEE